MGLDAPVYRNTATFENDPDRKHYKDEIDNYGVLIPKNESIDPIGEDRLVAITEYMGNSPTRSYLVRKIKSYLGADSILITAVLHSETDVVSVLVFTSICNELDLLEKVINDDDKLSKFIVSVRRLIEIGYRENNPIIITG